MTGNDDASTIKKDQTVNLKITDLNHRGEGVGRVNSFTFFVPHVLPGEYVTAIVTSLHNNFGEAKPEAVTKTSPFREKPLCPYFPRCGGCRLQHLNYKAQLNWKHKMISEVLRRIAGIEIPVEPVIGMQNPWRFRNKAQIHFGLEKDKVIAGFYEYGSRNIIDIKQCVVQHPANEQAINIIRRELQAYIDRTENSAERKLPVTGATIRTSFIRGSCVIAFQAAPGRTYINKLKELALKITANSGGIVQGITLLHTGRKKSGETVLSGATVLEEEIFPFQYRISPLSFFQVNPSQAGILYNTGALLSGEPRTAYDLYCGTGNFSLYLSQKSEHVIGIDVSDQAINDARENAALNSIKNTTFINTPAEKIKDILFKGVNPKIVYLNPPRRGASPALLTSVAAANPERIVYISCNPATLARDLALLVKDGYGVKQIQPVDMFPHTTHVETVCLLQNV
ncbi:MAG: 23S rRNA (uracil(1939)-C(5))-methyltransferase RlmD [Firmicutes bacterium]|nr:23S rRNA (uracil(1939)-C(5))-methyltransferase RlmD [Bacillota bacterium]